MKKAAALCMGMVILFQVEVAAQTNIQPTQGVTVGYYNDKFGSHGMRLGYEVPVWQRFREGAEPSYLKHGLILKANLNFYNHKRHQIGVSMNVTFGYRYTSKSGFMIEPLHIGTGYLHSFLQGKTYKTSTTGAFEEVRFAGNSTFILPYFQLIGMGYDFRQRAGLPFLFMMSLDPYVQRSVNTQTRIRLATPITMTYFFK